MIALGAADAIRQVDALHWREFERLVQSLFEASGYACRYVGGKRDHGADVVAAKDGDILVVQVKHRSDGHRWVGERAVQGVVTALPLYAGTRAVVVTNSLFAPSVKAVARAHKVVLRDRAWLERELASFCVLCGARVSARVRRWCSDRPDEFGGSTYCFDHQRRLTDVLRTA